MDMGGDKAFSVTAMIPADHVEMGRTRCPHCNAEYIVVHQLPFQAESRVGRQIEILRETLTDDHVDPKFKAHLECYDGPLDNDFRVAAAG
jgi:hypothetical protein